MAIKEPSTKPSSLEIHTLKTIRQYGMLSPGDHVLVAVSGGADSTALLLVLHRLARDLGLSLSAAHLNHRIRGSEADADEAFVRQMSADLGIRFISESIEVRQQASAAKKNLEEYARRIRYDFLQRTARRVGAQKIAVGHTLNDQAETALFRFIRGSGIKGLSSIHPVVDGWIIRPLLDCSRDSILEYLKQKGARYREDSTNKDFRHARNRIRRELIPYLEAGFNPRLVSAITRHALQAQDAWDFMESEAKKALDTVARRIENGVSLERRQLLRLHPAIQKEVLREALKTCMGSTRGIRYVHIRSLLSLCSSERGGGRIRMPNGALAIRQFDALVLLKRESSSNPSYVYELSIPGQCSVKEAGRKFVCSIRRAPDVDGMKDMKFTRAFLAPSALPGSLTIRSRIPGDRYGGRGHRKVKKMLINSKVPSLKRASLPMVAAGSAIIWIPGFRPARGYEAPPGSPNCVAIEIFRETDM
jgi:tRNA(Ile)-lysidine synthase